MTDATDIRIGVIAATPDARIGAINVDYLRDVASEIEAADPQRANHLRSVAEAYAHQSAELERLKLAAATAPPVAETGYPNLDACLQGCVSGSPSEWPMIRGEILKLQAELERVRAELAAAVGLLESCQQFTVAFMLDNRKTEKDRSTARSLYVAVDAALAASRLEAALASPVPDELKGEQ